MLSTITITRRIIRFTRFIQRNEIQAGSVRMGAKCVGEICKEDQILKELVNVALKYVTESSRSIN